MVTKEEWVDWKQDPVTEAFHDACDERIRDAKEILAGTAGLDSANDNFNRGFIAAYEEIKNFRIEEDEGSDA